jgi:hypothetical protein
MDINIDSKEAMDIEQEKEKEDCKNETKNPNPSRKRKRKERSPPDFKWTKDLQPILPETIVYITKTHGRFHLTEHDNRAILTKTTYGEVADRYPNAIRCSADECLLDERDKKLKHRHELDNANKNAQNPDRQITKNNWKKKNRAKLIAYSRKHEQKRERKAYKAELEKQPHIRATRQNYTRTHKVESKIYHRNWYQQHVKPKIEAKKQQLERLTGSILSYLYAPYEVPSITIANLVREKVYIVVYGKPKQQPNRGKRNRPKDHLRRVVIEIQQNMLQKEEKEMNSNLDEIQIQTLILQPCFYCGRETDIATRKTINGLDRLDSSEGYVLANVVTCCHDCNMRKWTLDYSTFLQCIKNIVDLYNRCYDHFNNDERLLKGASYSQCKQRAKTRELDCKLSKEDFLKILTSKDANCYFCGYSNRYHLSLDRIDNDIGYELQNVQVCCVTCNYMRKDLPVEEFLRQCTAIYNHMKSKNWPSETEAKQFAQNIWQTALQSNSHALVKTRQPREKPALREFAETEHVYYIQGCDRFHCLKCDLIKEKAVLRVTAKQALDLSISPCGRCFYG